MALSDIIQPFQWGAGGARLTPEEIAKRRQIEDEMLARGVDMSPVGHWTQGLARVADAFAGSVRRGRLEKDAERNATENQQMIANLLSGGGQSPTSVSGQSFAGAPSSTSSSGATGTTAATAAGISQSTASKNPMEIATSLVGKGEVPDRATIQEYLKNGGINLDPATTAWCAAYVNSSLAQAGLKGTGSNLARSFLNYGEATDTPQKGDIAVFSRGDPNSIYGHVGFFDGINPDGTIRILAGNQGNAVDYGNMPADRLLGYRRVGGAPAAAEAMATGQPMPAAPTQVASLDPSIGMPQGAGSQGEIRRGTDGKSYQYAETTGMAGATGSNGWIPVNADTAPVQRVAQNAPSASPFGNINPAIIQALSNPYANDQVRSIAGILLQQQMQQNDPMRALEREKAQLEINQLRNPRPKYDFITGKDGSIFRSDNLGNINQVYGGKPDQPNDVREYEYAKGQGYAGTFQDFQLEQKRAGASQVNIDQKAEGQFEKTMAEGQAKAFNTMAEEGLNARADLGVIGELEGLLKGQGGTMSGIAGTLARYGIGGEGMDDLQAAQALINKLVPTQRQPGSGSMSDRDVELFTRSLPSLWNTPGGNEKILSVMRGLARYKQQQGEIADQVMTGEISRQEARRALRALPNPLDGFKPVAGSGREKQGASKPVTEMSDEELEAIINGKP